MSGTLATFLLASPPTVAQLQLFELSHSGFTQTFRVVRNLTTGVAVKHEDGSGPFTYSYFPVQIKPIGVTNDLSQSIEITFGDVGQVVPTQLDRASNLNRMTEKPLLVYREYRSDDLTTPMYGPFRFNVDKMAFNQTGVVLIARAASLTQGRVGLYYTSVLFPMLRAIR